MFLEHTIERNEQRLADLYRSDEVIYVPVLRRKPGADERQPASAGAGRDDGPRKRAFVR